MGFYQWLFFGCGVAFVATVVVVVAGWLIDADFPKWPPGSGW